MSKEASIKKDKVLGIPHGTASHQLRKMIMFQMIQELKRDVCFRCGEKIENIDDLSIEHKKSWLLSENPKEAFFDLDNIAFSHLSCNFSSGYRHERVNSKNETGFKGVKNTKRNLEKPYSAAIWKDKKMKHLGYFDTPEKASIAYQKELENK